MAANAFFVFGLVIIDIIGEESSNGGVVGIYTPSKPIFRSVQLQHPPRSFTAPAHRIHLSAIHSFRQGQHVRPSVLYRPIQQNRPDVRRARVAAPALRGLLGKVDSPVLWHNRRSGQLVRNLHWRSGSILRGEVGFPSVNAFIRICLVVNSKVFMTLSFNAYAGMDCVSIVSGERRIFVAHDLSLQVWRSRRLDIFCT